MKKVIKNTLLSVCAVALLAGCASKEPEYDSQSGQNTGSMQDTVGADQRVSNISGGEEQVVDNAGSILADDKFKMVTNEGVNSVESEIDGNVVLLESVHFGFDKYNLSDEMREVATANYGKISEVQEAYSNVKIKLEGNCDEWGTDEYNYALGLKRAKTAKDALIADGINADKILMVSFGESNPVCNQKNQTCWKMNRRVDYRLLP